MKKFTATVTILFLTALILMTTVRAEETKFTSGSIQAFPELLIRNSPELQRFSDPRYFRMLASGGIRTADPKVLFQRIAAATKGGEGYKALYLARIFTELQPENRTGWTNRAQLAGNLGFAVEATVAQAIAETGSVRPVPGGALPGALSARPATLSDWAAALALLADDVTAREGRPMIVAVNDDLSGISVASNEAIQREGRGPWATAKPVQIDHVLGNLFAMPQATPMDRKSMKGGLFALGALAMAASAYSTSIGAADAATQYSELYGTAMAQAFEVPSDFKGGTFIATTYHNGTARTAKRTPKTAGKHEAVGTPVPVLWASGPSLSPAIYAAWRSGDSNKSEAIKIDAKTKKQEWKKYAIPALLYPRMQQLCASPNQCSSRLTLVEVLLSAEDIQVLAPGLESRLPDLSSWATRYASGQSISLASAGERFTGFDASGVLYITRQRPTEWLTSATTTAGQKPSK